ncbi:MAG: alpha/beta fold hydrolase [Sphingorhabdus sp.]
MKRLWSADELGERWTLSPDDVAFIADNADAGRLGLACQLTFWRSQGRFPDEEADLAPVVIAHLAGQIGVAADVESYTFTDRSGRRHRQRVLDYLAVGTFDHAAEATAKDQVAMMRALGHERFQLVGHDRGGRVAHRMGLDFPDVVERMVVIDIAPTATMYARTNMDFARAYFWWFFLIQPYPLPEHLIGGDPDFFLDGQLARQLKVEGAADSRVVAQYRRCYSDPAARHAMCEDYRVGAGIDLEHDAADAVARLVMPLLALWGALGTVGRLYDVVETWREKALDVRGFPLECGHSPQEEVPGELMRKLDDFLIGAPHPG